MEEILDKLVKEIKLDQRYLEYIDAEKKLHTKDIECMLKEYQEKLNEYEDLKKYDRYIDNNQLKEEIKSLKRQIGCNNDILDYYRKYHCLNDYLEEITKIVFGNISNQLDLSPYKL